MIVGVGIDICEVSRIEKALEKSYSQNFKKKIFTQNEIDYCEKFAKSAQSFAARWAIKEAFYKALPLELQELSGWQSIEFINENGNKPFIKITDEKLVEAFEKNKIVRIHSTVSHEKEFCVAQVILES